MNRGNLRAVFLVAAVATIAQPARAEVTAEQVRTAIAKGVGFLKNQQDKVRGNWPEHAGQPGGLTALCVLALVNAGEDPQEPYLQRALDYLRSIERPTMTYAAALRTMAFCAAEPERDLVLIRQNAAWLESTQNKEGPRRGAWSYSSSRGGGDNSNTQFALLALHEAERAGVEIQENTWRLALDYWIQNQENDGSWTYYKNVPPLPATGSMTCAGVASLVIAAGKLSEGDARIGPDGSVECCGRRSGEAQNVEDRIERGLEWLGQRFSVYSNPGNTSWLLYYLYAVERVGRLTGRRFLGQHDWYREGADMLVSRQDRLSGFWMGTGHIERNPIVSTSFALLFLSKGRRPVVVSQLRHGVQGIGAGRDWNQHRSAIRNLTQRVEQSWKRDLTWQTVDANSATVADLLEAPVVFLSGSRPLELSAKQKTGLRDYVMQGGFLFVEACDGDGCRGEEFDRSFRALMRELFPSSPLRKLPPDHAVWYADRKVDPRNIPPQLWLEGVEACCRTSVVYCPRSLSCYWELSPGNRRLELAEPAAGRIEACLRIGQNVLAYATNRELKEKLDRPRVTVDDNPNDQLTRGTLRVPKLVHDGGANEAPNALANLLRVCRREVQMRASSDRILIEATDPNLFDFPILFMHGRRSFRFSAAERRALAEFLQRGGFVFADAICASPEFAESVRREFQALLAEQRFERIPPDHPLFTTEYRGFDLSSVTLRDPQARRGDDPLEARLTRTTPVLEGLMLNDRLAVILSPYDISCALENQASLECKGYVTADAARIGVNVILFALEQ